LWASTALRFLGRHDPRKRLDSILQGDIASGAEAAVDALYITALESLEPPALWEDDDFVQAFRDILGVVLVARQPLSSIGIDALFQRPSMHTISRLASLLQQSPTIRVLHPSFADFLTTKNRCGREV
jgi:hypothetical protein